MTKVLQLGVTTDHQIGYLSQCQCYSYLPRDWTAAIGTKVWFAVDVEVRAVLVEQDQRAPIKMVSGRAWSPGIYQALRLID
jgi:hypothetical protein